MPPPTSITSASRFERISREPRKKLTAMYLVKKLCQCLGLASLMLVMNYGDLLGGGADVRMHVPFALAHIAWAQLLGIIVLGGVLFLVLAPLSQTQIYPWVRLVLAMLAPPYLIYRMQALFEVIMFDGLVPIIFAVWAAFMVLLLLRYRRLYNSIMKLGDTIGVFLFMFALCSAMQLLWVMHWRPGPHVLTAAWSRSLQPPREHPKVVWIIFDELSYDQTFEHRAHGLDLPHFDALRSQSTLFTDVQPIGYKTVRIIPSLFTGKVVDDYRFRMNNTLAVHYTGEHGWQPLHGSNSIFGDAKANGWRTAVVGWYNPYCTIYGDAIDQCYFMNLDRIDGLMSQKDTVWRNTWSPLEQMVREVRAPARADRRACNYDVKQRLMTHLDLEKHWVDLLHTDQADFIYLHMSIPHSPNVWSRIADDYTQQCHSSYLDSLALADRELGKVMDELQASPRWKDTTLIVEGDHSWRVDLWDWLPSWTDEDDAASHDTFDPRPALIIHQPGQTQPQTVSQPWPLLRVHDVVENVIKGSPAVY
jgi:hypothetical protein